MVYYLGLFEMLGVDGEYIVSEILKENKTRRHKSHPTNNYKFLQ
ncbi:MAG: hypothetical protein QXY45_03830 [Candidatus Aenigmatarchaeota archaeon]